MAAEYPAIQGRYPSWSSSEIKLDNKIYTGLTALKWDEALTPTKVYGTGVVAAGYTKGEHEANASMTMHLPAWQAFRKQLADKSATREYGTQEFGISASWRETDDDPVQSVELLRCRVQKVSRDNAKGPDAALVEVELCVIRIKEDGTDVLVK